MREPSSKGRVTSLPTVGHMTLALSHFKSQSQISEKSPFDSFLQIVQPQFQLLYNAIFWNVIVQSDYAKVCYSLPKHRQQPSATQKCWLLWPQIFNWKMYLLCWSPCLPPSEKHLGTLKPPTLWFCEGSKQQNIYSHQCQCWLRTAGRPVENQSDSLLENAD